MANSNCVVESVESSPPRGSFLVAGRGLGPSVGHPGFRHHITGSVDLQREYDYPEQYQPWLAALALISTGSFLCFWILFLARLPEKNPAWQIEELVAEASQEIFLWCGLGAASLFAVLHLVHCARHGPSEALPLSRTELRHLVGRTACTFWSIALFLVGLSLRVAGAKAGTAWTEGMLYVEDSLAAILVMCIAWCVVRCTDETEPVKAGLLASIFWSGALFAGEAAKYGNTGLMWLWAKLDPECNMWKPMGPAWPLEDPSKLCVAKALTQWILTPGLVEESLKFMVLLRLVASVQEASTSCWLTRCPRMSIFPFMPCCGWVLKLAKSPVVVVLCGMASGAGFSTHENSLYLKRLRHHRYAPLLGLVRVYAAMLHISLTGTSAFFLALSMHLKKRYVRYLGLIVMMVAHGCFDAFSSFAGQPAKIPGIPPEIGQCFARATCHVVKADGEIQLWGCHMNKTSPLVVCLCRAVQHHTCADQRQDQEDVDPQAQTLPCYLLPPEAYVCKARYVSWSPWWAAPLLGLSIIVLFSVLLCCVTPAVERHFQRRPQESQDIELEAREIADRAPHAS